MVWSVSNWDILFEGRVADFYTEKIINTRGAIQLGGCSSPLMLIPQMIWNFPIWITHYFNGKRFVGTIFCVYWYKLFLLAVTLMIGILIYRIINRMTGEKKKAQLGMILMLGSAQTMLSTMYTGQDEIVYLLAILLSYDALIQKKKKWFIVWGIVSVTLCPIMIIGYAVLVVLSEKNLIKIVGKILLSIIPNGLWSLYSIGMENKIEVSINDSEFIDKMMNMAKFPITTGDASIVGIIICIIFILAYLTKKEKTELYLLYLNSIMVLISFFMDNFFYRLLIYVPFTILTILVITKEERTNMSLLLFTILEYIRMFVGGYESLQNLNTAYVAKSKIMEELLIKSGSNAIDGYRYVVGKICEHIKMAGSIVPLLNSMSIVCVGAILFIACYSKRDNNLFKMDINRNYIIDAYIACMPIIMIIFFTILFR
ncbi:hypothetical protein [Butyrivibrio sp. NC3005]|uniref:hypothetical protein n=1 Tax=Butyrivibrio sp. NC3005 TaxID=1280685 RepID=UPI0003F600A5|nr:hypothetical protein [Butyrivibrio sp. NC3005]